MKHEMKLNNDEYYNIKNGLKDIEVRVNDKKRKQIKRNDIIEFSNVINISEKVFVKVVDITNFKTFNDLYGYYPLERFGPDNKSKKELISTIYKIYSRKEEQLGVLAIEIELYNKEGKHESE